MWGLAVGIAITAGGIAPAAAVNSALSLVPLITLAGWLVQATTEEYIYRGWLLIKLRSRFQTPAAVLLSALIFSATHGVNPDTTLIAYLNLTLAGLWFALMTLRTGGITAAALAHTMWNWTEGSGMGLWSKGDDPQGGELLHFVFAKPGLFGGPGTGMNDGLALGIAFTLLIVLELVLRRGAAADKFPETTAS
jgi:membrane protease YdiL (CAAX protease family)